MRLKKNKTAKTHLGMFKFTMPMRWKAAALALGLLLHTAPCPLERGKQRA